MLTMLNAQTQDQDLGPIVAEAERTLETLRQVRAEVGRVIIGQDQVIEQALCAILAGGHGLLVGVPGVAKTKLVQCLGVVLGLSSKRVQFTPDLLPSDILGSEILDESAEGQRAFRFVPGPVFCQLLMADEINRASPRTQSALLQAMQEGQVTVAGHTYQLPQPYHVLATQNPVEQEGTYPLPEAQLDRFLLHIDIGFPSREAERQILLSTTGIDEPEPSPVLSPASLLAAQRLVREIPTPDHVLTAVLDLVRAARPGPERPELLWGAGPRAAQALLMTARARALLNGRFAPVLEDVLALAVPALKHRLAIAYGARADGLTPEGLIQQLCGRLG
jgi:MoxR-like ATPase